MIFPYRGAAFHPLHPRGHKRWSEALFGRVEYPTLGDKVGHNGRMTEMYVSSVPVADRIVAEVTAKRHLRDGPLADAYAELVEEKEHYENELALAEERIEELRARVDGATEALL